MTSDEGHVTVVTGGGQGIGFGIANVLASRGHMVSIWDIDMNLAKASAEVLCEYGFEAEGRRIDVTDFGEVTAGADVVTSTYGSIDGLVNCAMMIRRGRLEDISTSDWNTTLAVGLTGVFACSQVIGRKMVARRQGAIVNIASISAWNPQPLLGSYSACKAGVIALTQQMAVEWGARGVRCNAISPGQVRTNTSEAVYSNKEFFELRRRLVPLDRIGTPNDIGKVVAFLLSDDSSYVNGVNITVDGGFTLGITDNLPSIAPNGTIIQGPISRTSPLTV